MHELRIAAEPQAGRDAECRARQHKRSPETLSFTPNASFLPCAPGLVCPDPGKMPENISFSPNSACFDLALGCILLLTGAVLVRKDFAQDALCNRLKVYYKDCGITAGYGNQVAQCLAVKP